MSMGIVTFLGICLVIIAAIAYVVGLSTGTRNERTAGNAGCAFDWLWGIAAVVIVLALMGASVKSVTTGEPFENPVSLVGTPIDDARAQAAEHVFGILFGENHQSQ